MPENKPINGELMLDGASALTAQTRAEFDIQITTAKAYPRSITEFKAAVLDLATLDEDTAASMFYALPRGNKTIEGPSVRLAEIVASTYGNLRAGARVVAIDDKFVTAEGVAFDLENNFSVQHETKRRITDRSGRRYNDDMIQTASNAACAIAMRQAIFKVVPKAYYDPAYRKAREVAVGNQVTLVNRRAKMLEHFAKLGISERQICDKVQKEGIDDIGASELGDLIGLATAIRDGDTSIDDAFRAPVDATPKQPSGGVTAEDLNTAPVEIQPKDSKAASGSEAFRTTLLEELAGCKSIKDVTDVARKYVASGTISDADAQYLELNCEATKEKIRQASSDKQQGELL